MLRVTREVRLKARVWQGRALLSPLCSLLRRQNSRFPADVLPGGMSVPKRTLLKRAPVGWMRPTLLQNELTLPNYIGLSKKLEF